MIKCEPHTSTCLQIIYGKLHGPKELILLHLYEGKAEHALLLSEIVGIIYITQHLMMTVTTLIPFLK